MIRVTIRQEAERRGITTPYQLSKNLGLKGRSKALRLWEGKALPKLETLDHICTTWKCDLSALIHCAPEPAQKKRRPRKL